MEQMIRHEADGMQRWSSWCFELLPWLERCDEPYNAALRRGRNVKKWCFLFDKPMWKFNWVWWLLFSSRTYVTWGTFDQRSGEWMQIDSLTLMVKNGYEGEGKNIIVSSFYVAQMLRRLAPVTWRLGRACRRSKRTREEEKSKKNNSHV